MEQIPSVHSCFYSQQNVSLPEDSEPSDKLTCNGGGKREVKPSSADPTSSSLGRRNHNHFAARRPLCEIATPDGRRHHIGKNIRCTGENRDAERGKRLGIPVVKAGLPLIGER